MPDPTESAAGFSRAELEAYIHANRNDPGWHINLATYCQLLMDERERDEIQFNETNDHRIEVLRDLFAERAAHDLTAEALGFYADYESWIPTAMTMRKRAGWEGKTLGGGTIKAITDSGKTARTALAAYEEMRKETKEKA